MLKSNAGYSTGEIVLACTMVASVGAAGIAFVPWDGILASNSEQLVSQLEQFENANLAFRSRYQVWPHQATGGDAERAAAALMDQSVLTFPYNSLAVTTEKLLPAKEYKIEGTHLEHRFGGGGLVKQYAARGADGRAVLEVELENVPIQLAREADAAIDGRYDPTSGRVTIDFGNTLIAPEVVTVRFQANRVG